ncbi:recombinase family protein [Pseudonocardia sp. ICBG601]|uniref:recombinase family protein n=1 Tax=Pseudonocardia sp. ICBG601 TaxID=2846759 RepID=UPI001CF6D193|nr:recombinase family protein [Pseudonocardia sp. ICBG601]
MHRIEAGQLPLRIPFGYRRPGSGPALDSDGPITAWGAYDPDAEPQTDASRLGRAGRAPASTWVLDVHTAWAVAEIYLWASCGESPQSISVRLRTSWPLRPTLVTATGRPLPWTATRVRAVLLDPSYLGHSVWGRSRPRESWTISTTTTHPPLITTSTADHVARVVSRGNTTTNDWAGWGR